MSYNISNRYITFTWSQAKARHCYTGLGSYTGLGRYTGLGTSLYRSWYVAIPILVRSYTGLGTSLYRSWYIVIPVLTGLGTLLYRSQYVAILVLVATPGLLGVAVLYSTRLKYKVSELPALPSIYRNMCKAPS